MRSNQELPILIDIPAAAEILSTSVRHVRTLVASRQIPYIKVGHYVRFDLDEIKTWIKSNHMAEWRWE
jgi:excisionase family DNA binding protein